MLGSRQATQVGASNFVAARGVQSRVADAWALNDIPNHRQRALDCALPSLNNGKGTSPNLLASPFIGEEGKRILIETVFVSHDEPPSITEQLFYHG